MARKLKTMERDFWFDLNDEADEDVQGIAFVDLAQVASLVNRVSLRQGMQYVVESIEFVTNGQLQAYVFRCPEHWPAINAWEKSYHHWKEQQDEAAREAGLQSTKAQWRDFKIFMNSLHSTAGTANNLLPAGYLTTGATTKYEWDASEVVVPNDGGVAGNTQQYQLHLLGDDGTTKGLIKAYAESRSRPHSVDPNVVDVDSGGLFGEMIDVGEIQTDVVDNYQGRNNEPPYLLSENTPDEFYPGGVNQGQFVIAGTNTFDGQLEGVCTINAVNTNFGSTVIPGFVAPLGLLGISYKAENLSPIPSPYNPGDPYLSLGMRITLAPGGYKGLLAQDMKEAN